MHSKVLADATDIYFLRNGNGQVIWAYSLNQDGRKDGEERIYFENGNWLVRNWKNGNKNGFEVLKTRENKILHVYFFKDGKLFNDGKMTALRSEE